jgi:hypothetical protein
MAEVLTSFSTPIRDDFGLYYARAVGRHGTDHMWEGWVEFVPADGGGDVLVGSIESRQPEREHLVYWATGLTPVYLEGALRRARKPVTVRVPVIDEPMSNGPAQRRVVMQRTIPGPEPVLDPFDVGERSIDILRQELTALNRPRLLNIIAAYNFAPGLDVGAMSDPQLVGVIVGAVERRRSTRSH